MGRDTNIRGNFARDLWGENIVQKGEELLDAIENASDNSGVGTMIQAAEKAGLTKDAVLGTVSLHIS